MAIIYIDFDAFSIFLTINSYGVILLVALRFSFNKLCLLGLHYSLMFSISVQILYLSICLSIYLYIYHLSFYLIIYHLSIYSPTPILISTYTFVSSYSSHYFISHKLYYPLLLYLKTCIAILQVLKQSPHAYFTLVNLHLDPHFSILITPLPSSLFTYCTVISPIFYYPLLKCICPANDPLEERKEKCKS